MSQTRNIRIRRAEALTDYEACVALQQEAWQFSNPYDCASVPLMRVQNQYGGCVLIAEDTEGRTRGFSYALLCRESEGSAFWWSHMTAVSRALRGTGLGFALKAAQRSEALGHGISEIRWTFDPMQAMNAHFNIRKLGTVAVRYLENVYGVSSSPLHRDLPTDRLEARWDIASDRVAERIAGTTSVIMRDFDGIVRVLESRNGEPGSPHLDHRETPLLVEIPLESPSRPQAETSFKRWQISLRATFSHYLAQGYVATDFILIDEPAPHAFYVLER